MISLNDRLSPLKKISLIGGACSGGVVLSLSGEVSTISISDLPSILTGGLDFNDGTATWNIDGIGGGDMFLAGRNSTSSRRYSILFGRNTGGVGWNSAGAIDTTSSFVLNAASFANNASMTVRWGSVAQEVVTQNDFISFSATIIKTAQFQFNNGANVGWIYLTVNDSANPTVITAVEVNGKAGQWGLSGDTFNSATAIPEPAHAVGALGLLAAGAAGVRHLRKRKKNAA